MKGHRKRILAWVATAALMLAACATAPEPFEYQPDNELKPGAGFLTGEEGAWTIMRQEPPAEAETTPGEDTKTAAGKIPEETGTAVPHRTETDAP
jgi:hypothetical protein